MNKHSPKILLGLLLFALLALVVRIWSTREHVETPAELTQLALQGGSPQDQESAAVRLEALAGRLQKTGTRNAAQTGLGRLLAESKNPGVRAAAMRALASIWDYEYMSTMLDLLDHESLLIRRTAGRAVESLLSLQHNFDAAAKPEDRKVATERLRGVWKVFQTRTLKNWQKRLETKDAK